MSAPLREGYTTGTCAAAATLAAALLLVRGQRVTSVALVLPCGREAELPVLFVETTAGGARAGVRKDAGDDPDITHQALVIAEVTLGLTAAPSLATPPASPNPQQPAAPQNESAQNDSASPFAINGARSDTRSAAATSDANLDARQVLAGVCFVAGEGVGTVTRPGLQLAVGEPAINPIPRLQIAQALRSLTDRPATVKLSIPGGAELATKTFNPRLGVVGGLSVIGTSGIVRPFSHAARRESVLCTLRVAAATLANRADATNRRAATNRKDAANQGTRSDLHVQTASSQNRGVFFPTISSAQTMDGVSQDVPVTVGVKAGDGSVSGAEGLYLVPGHYGAAAAGAILGAPAVRIVEVGNEWDCALPALSGLGVEMVWIVGHPGKLAKFLAEQFQTHSASSDSALPAVMALAAELGLVTGYAGATVEGFFHECLEADALRVATTLAARIAQAAQARTCAFVRVLLIDLQGRELGRF